MSGYASDRQAKLLAAPLGVRSLERRRELVREVQLWLMLVQVFDAPGMRAGLREALAQLAITRRQ